MNQGKREEKGKGGRRRMRKKRKERQRRGGQARQCKRRLDSAQNALGMLSDRSCVAARRGRVAVKK